MRCIIYVKGDDHDNPMNCKNKLCVGYSAVMSLFVQRFMSDSVLKRLSMADDSKSGVNDFVRSTLTFQ